MNTRICRKTQIRQMFLLVFGGQICAPQRDTNVVLSYKAIIILLKILIPSIRHIAKIPWRGFFYFPGSRLSVLNGLHFYF